MQDADEGEETPRGVDVDLGLALQPLLHDARAFVVDSAAGHVDRLDLGGRQLLHGVEIALADLEVVLHDLPERAEGQMEFSGRIVGLGPDVEDEAAVADRESQPVGSVRRLSAVAGGKNEGVVFEKVEDRDLSLLRDLGRWWREPGIVDLDVAEAGGHPASLFSRSSRARTESPCASRLSDFASVSAAGPMARSASGVIRAVVVRLRKSMTESPEEKRAERAVGRTWFGPPT